MAKRYILQQKCLNRQIGTCLLGTYFGSVLLSLEPECTALQIDRRRDDRITPIADHTVWQYDRLCHQSADWLLWYLTPRFCNFVLAHEVLTRNPPCNIIYLCTEHFLYDCRTTVPYECLFARRPKSRIHGKATSVIVTPTSTKFFFEHPDRYLSL